MIPHIRVTLVISPCVYTVSRACLSIDVESEDNPDALFTVAVVAMDSVGVDRR